jgi:chemotaxis protein methyltransferase CheR
MRDLLKRKSGLIVNPDKVYLLESRLTPLARHQGLESLDELINKVRVSRDEKLIAEVTDAMTTNESFFFRDNTPFDIMKKHVLPFLNKNRANKKLRIWCAAASSGQEPYSLAMILKEQQYLWKDWDIEIYATDISNKIIDKAREARYSQFEVQRGLPIQMMMKYFRQESDGWFLNDDIKNMVKFEYMNLLEPLRQRGPFDVVFCRNVLIYFDQPTKSAVLERIGGVISKDGSLFLGAAETVLGISDKFKPVKGQRGIYVPTQMDATAYGGV